MFYGDLWERSSYISECRNRQFAVLGAFLLCGWIVYWKVGIVLKRSNQIIYTVMRTIRRLAVARGRHYIRMLHFGRWY